MTCRCGCGTTVMSGRTWVSGHNSRRYESPKTPKAQVSPAVKDLYWVAGFLEGEGTFGHNKLPNGHYGVRVVVGQVQREPLDRLARLLGGRIYWRGDRIHQWVVTGGRARGVMLTLYPLMSPRRQTQIRAALQ